MTEATIVRDARAVAAGAVAMGVPYLILPVFNAASETKGSTAYNKLIGINTALEEEHGPNFYDLRGYIIRHGLRDAGITPTSADNTAATKDLIPASFQSDNIHINAIGNQVIGRRLAAVTTQKGWYTE